MPEHTGVLGDGTLKMPEEKQSKKLKRFRSNYSEKTIYHMGVFDIEAADDLRKSWHRVYLESVLNRDMLVPCFEVLDNYLMVVENILAPWMKRNINEEIEELEVEVYAVPVREMTEEGYVKLRKRMRKVMKRIYEAKQAAGLGIPKEKLKMAAEKMADALK